MVIASDIARYGLHTPGEPTQGAGAAAAAMIVTANPRMIEIDAVRTGSWSRDVHDFWRPLSSPDALVDGAFSLDCYLDALRNSFRLYAEAETEDQQALEKQFDALLFHVPFVKMTDKGHKALLELTRGNPETEAVADSYAKRVRSSLRVASQVGNAYSASLWLALASAIEFGDYPIGAGSVPSLTTLDQRTAIDVLTYERWMAERLGPGPFSMDVTPFSPFVYLGVKDNQRVYERLAVAVGG